jgi:hypothetical protein
MKNKNLEIETFDRRLWEHLREFRKIPYKKEYMKKKKEENDLFGSLS